MTEIREVYVTIGDRTYRATQADVRILTREEYDAAGGDPETADWWAIRLAAPYVFTCGATLLAFFEVDHPHRTIVWPTRDDPNLLRVLARLTGGPKVVPYDAGLGEPVSYYDLHPS